jgi:hypothetical protein
MTGIEAHRELDADVITQLTILPDVPIYLKIPAKGRLDPLTINFKYEGEHGFLKVHVSRIIKFPDQ